MVKLQACTGSRILSDCCTGCVTRIMLAGASDLQATRENSGLGENLKQQPGNKNPGKGSIVDESGQAGGEFGSCVPPLTFHLTGQWLFTLELISCCLRVQRLCHLAVWCPRSPTVSSCNLPLTSCIIFALLLR